MGIRSEVREGVPIARVAQKYGVSRQSIYNLLRASAEAIAERTTRLAHAAHVALPAGVEPMPKRQALA